MLGFQLIRGTRSCIHLHGSGVLGLPNHDKSVQFRGLLLDLTDIHVVCFVR